MTFVVHLVAAFVVFLLGKTVAKSFIKRYVGNWDELTAIMQVKRWLIFGLFMMVIPFYIAALIATEILGFPGSRFYHTLPHLLNIYYFCPLPKKWLQGGFK